MLFSKRPFFSLITPLLAAMLLIQDGAAQQPTLKRIVATTTIIADITRRIAPQEISVESLMAEGVDPHQYRASPGEMRKMLAADLVLYNGLHLEGKLDEVLVGIAKRLPVVSVSDPIARDTLRRVNSSEEGFDPHIWFDVGLWSQVAQGIATTVAERAPEHAELIRNNSDNLQRELAELSQWIKDQIATLPSERRVLVTAHDAFGYFGRAYGVEVLSIQGINTASEVSLKTIEALVTTLVQKKVPAIFFENSVPKRSIEALIEGCKVGGHSIALGGELYSDALGARTSDASTYISMVRHNVNTIVSALGEKKL